VKAHPPGWTTTSTQAIGGTATQTMPGIAWNINVDLDAQLAGTYATASFLCAFLPARSVATPAPSSFFYCASSSSPAGCFSSDFPCEQCCTRGYTLLGQACWDRPSVSMAACCNPRTPTLVECAVADGPSAPLTDARKRYLHFAPRECSSLVHSMCSVSAHARALAHSHTRARCADRSYLRTCRRAAAARGRLTSRRTSRHGSPLWVRACVCKHVRVQRGVC
jgi:hypothetical protein